MLSATQVYTNVNAALLPYFEEAALHSLYNPKKPWESQPDEVPGTPIAIFKCPSSGASQSIC